MIKAGDSLQGGAVYQLTTDRVHERFALPDIFENKKVLVFGGPAPFSRLDTEQALAYASLSNELKEAGVDAIYGIYCQDAFVMEEFNNKVKATYPDHCIDFFADGDAYFTRSHGLEYNFTNQGLSMRSIRYAAIVDNSKFEYVVEDDFSEINKTSATSLLEYLKSK